MRVSVRRNNSFFYERGCDIMSEGIKWTSAYIESLNDRLKKVGLPAFVIDNGVVYKDELRKFLGIGIQLEDEESQ